MANADTYHTAHGDSSDWSGATTAAKEEALRLATQYLDLVYGGSWKGKRVEEVQALDWPRTGVVDRDGWTIDSDIVPPRVEDATSEMALRHITETADILPDISKPGDIKSESVGAGQGAASKSVTYVGGGRSQIKSFRKVDLLVRDLITISRKIIRV